MEKTTTEQKIQQRVEALLHKMTLDQKVGQMIQTERMSITPAEVKQYHIGSVLSGGGSCPGDNTPADWIAMNDAYWAASMEVGRASFGHSNYLWSRCHPWSIIMYLEQRFFLII